MLKPQEVSTDYEFCNDRYVVSLIVTYPEFNTATPEEAALAALELTRVDAGQTCWHVYDRQTGVMHKLYQRNFDNEEN